MEDIFCEREHLGKGIFVCMNKTHRFSTDSVLLADFAKIGAKDIACDFGTGCGVIPMIWSVKGGNDITGIEINPEAFELFSKSIEDNGMTGKIKAVNGDIREIKNIFPSGKFSLVTMNPPYFSLSSGLENADEGTNTARHETNCDIFDAAKSASYLLKFGGRFCVCHRPERLCDVFEAMRKNKIEPKRLRLVCARSNKEPWLVLVEGKKGGKVGLKAEKMLYIKDENGNYTEEVREIYGDYATF